jgi:hypothetical protein
MSDSEKQTKIKPMITDIKPRVIEVVGTLSKDGTCSITMPNIFLNSNSNVNMSVKLKPSHIL